MAHRNRWFTELKHGDFNHGKLLVSHNQRVPVDVFYVIYGENLQTWRITPDSCGCE